MQLDLESMLSARPVDEVEMQALLPPGWVVDGWKVVAKIGSGRSAEVYRVINLRIGGEGALKLLVDDNFGLRDRFELEREMIRSLALECLPRFFAAGSIDGRPYYIMEYLQPLLLPLEGAEVVPFMRSLALAVGSLHEAGYLHRDLKPGNVLRRRDGSPVLIDLGLIAKTDSPQPFHAPKYAVGTIDFAAPEQMLKGEATVAGDVYSLGMMLKAAARTLPPRLKRVVSKATAADPHDRYPTAGAFASALSPHSRFWRVVFYAASLAFAALSGALLTRSIRPNPDGVAAVPSATPVRGEVLVLAERPSILRLAEESDEEYYRRLKPLAEQGDASAAGEVAEALFYGRGVETNRTEAVRFYTIAAEGDVPGAQVSLGNCLLRGIGCERDDEAAARWLLRAAHGGNLGAMNDLAFCFLNGRGVDRDLEQGFRWALEAAQRGHPGAQTTVGECYLTGTGVESDHRRSDLWLQRAARQGNERAQMLLREQ